MKAGDILRCKVDICTWTYDCESHYEIISDDGSCMKCPGYSTDQTGCGLWIRAGAVLTLVDVTDSSQDWGDFYLTLLYNGEVVYDTYSSGEIESTFEVVT
jgi:hypothetical protein